MPYKKGYIPWNKGKKGLQVGWNKGLKGSTLGKALTVEKEEERKKKISEAMKKYGGYRIGGGRGKKGWYKGFFCDSSWELAFVIYCLDHKIKIERKTTKLDYIFNGKVYGNASQKYKPRFPVDRSFLDM